MHPPWRLLLARPGPPEAGDARPHSKVRLAAWGECAVLGRGKRCGRVVLGGKQEAAAG